MIKQSDALARIKPYEAGKPIKALEREYQVDRTVKLASNENPFGFSDTVPTAVHEALHDMHRYPEPDAPDLCRKLADFHQVSPQHIVLGNGSDDVIALLAHGFLNPGDQALMPLPSFLMYEISVRTAKGEPVMVPLNGFDTNLPGIVSRLTPATRLLFLTNPFNPTGSMITQQEFAAFIDQLPRDILIVMDEAYMEFARDPDIYNSLRPPLTDPRIVTLRTFSKAYGLAGFRIGYGIMDPSVAEILHRIRQPFNVNGLAQAAAEAALDDSQFIDRSVTKIHQGIDYLGRELRQLGLNPLPTQANFLMVDVKTDATAVFKQLLMHGIIVRSMASYGYDTFLRVNAGLPEENRMLIDALKQVLQTDIKKGPEN